MYEAGLTNSRYADINTTLAGKALDHRSFIVGTLTSRNGSAQAPNYHPPTPLTTAEAAEASNKRSRAMIAVYVITGFLAAMVCITIFSVVRRSLQPARTGAYIPGGAQDPPPRRVGLAQAIVDTFPLQKFHKPQNAKELHSQSELDLELPVIPSKRPESTIASSSIPTTGSDSRRTSTITSNEAQCPICLLEFETGDDLRVLPCEGQHRFHQACVDPWLLRVSTSCPLCRKGKCLLTGTANTQTSTPRWKSNRPMTRRKRPYPVAESRRITSRSSGEHAGGTGAIASRLIQRDRTGEHLGHERLTKMAQGVIKDCVYSM